MKFLITAHFLRQAKSLKKRFPNLKKDLVGVLQNFQPEHQVHVGRAIYKIRVKSRDLNKGKSGGLRAYVYLFKKKGLLVPICIYSKSDRENIGEKELLCHFQKTLEEVVNIIVKR